MPSLAALGPSFYDRVQKRIRPSFLTAIKDWRESDCTNPAKYPSKHLAPNWGGPTAPCHVHGPDCHRCHSCSACRPEQREPTGDWDDWLYLGGRGTGKTRSAAELVAEKMATRTRWRVCILAPTYADARDTCVEGESGLIAVFDTWGWLEGPKGTGDYTWNRSLGELKVHSTGARAKLFSAEKPARLRGPQHHFAWVEELAQVVRDAPDAWDMMKFGLRLGRHPQCVATTTPLPLHLLKELLVDPRCVTSRGTTDDNAANLAGATLRALHKKYDGTRLGRQELGGDLLDDIPGALWKRAWFDLERIPLAELPPDFPLLIPDHADPEDAERIRTTARVYLSLHLLGITLAKIVIGIDPAVTSSEDSDETGLVVVGKADNGRLYVLEDRSLRETPGTVMDTVIETFDRWGANSVIVEVNNGGDYIPGMLDAQLEIAGRRPGSIPCESVRAKKGKRVRAEPASALYEKRNVQHVGTHKKLEDQCCVWEASKLESPDRLDALVYAILHLEDGGTGTEILAAAGVIPRHQGGPSRMQMPTTSVRR